MSDRIDLHIHSTYSDGLSSPQEILGMVRRRRLAAFALCDHDNISGYRESCRLLGRNDPELISGVELSAGGQDEDLHILGYGFDPENDNLSEALEDFRHKRNRRGKKILSKLKGMGIVISYDLVMEIAGYSAIGRPHIADAMVRAGAIRNYETAFIHYIGNDGPAYVPKENLTPREAIALIHRAGGLAFLAHPGVGASVQYIDELIGLGIDGIEVYHPKHSSSQRRAYAAIVRENKLLAVGGSDYHGREGKRSGIGSQAVPLKWLEALKERLNKKDRG